MSTYSATATREGKWWVIDVDGVGVTQSRTLADADQWARGLIEAMTGQVDAQVELTVVADGLAEAKAAQALLAQAQRDVAEQAAIVRASVTRLTATMSQADAATALGVARQHVAQLAAAGNSKAAAG